MSSKIYFRNVRFHAFHGVLPQERIVGNDYLVNLVLDYDFSSAMKTDELQGTLNYAEVYQKVREEMAVPSKLLEHVAGRIAHTALFRFPGNPETPTLYHQGEIHRWVPIATAQG